MPKKRFKGTPLPLHVPNIGGYLNIIPTPSHITYKDIVIFSLSNRPGYNQIHIHRHRVGTGVTVSLKNTDDGAAPGAYLAAGDPLIQESIDACDRHFAV